MAIFLSIAVIAISIWLFLFEQKRLEHRYGITKQQDISGEEYCDLMPDVSRCTALKVREVLVKVTGWEAEEIHPHTRLIEFEIW